MKKLIIASLLFIGISSYAQDKKGTQKRMNRAVMEKFSPEQQNQLMLKKMTLELDLNGKQQEQIGQIISEQSKEREVMMQNHKEMREDNKKPTTDDRFEMKSKMLDKQIAMRDKMKKILSPEQFEKWHKMKKNHHGKNDKRTEYDKNRK
jgi:protein CpxP